MMSERVDPVFAALAWWPVLWHASAVGVTLCVPPPWRCTVAVTWVLVLPPLLCRLICVRMRFGTHSVKSAAARRWWWAQQVQMPFNRLPFLEELLRLVPGLYQTWLLMWGGRVSLWCSIAPRAAITDRQLVYIGRGSVLGDGVLLSGHLVYRDPQWRVTVAPVRIGRGALIGAKTIIAPGASVSDDEQVPVMQRLPPFSKWEGGIRHLAGVTHTQSNLKTACCDAVE
jgi:hypothetical protein